ncbi:hypothetical protein IV203_037108 [Nitzschia inconspicua]|uniref:Uncharacterized protein n=1 Tax=Nitzschia inconspicua TaxID=303405 RepID=A0A9K3LN82_9STRA|nr:hypothetical protein IV203_037108 [Nitzschia inconspicua]
MFILFVLVSIVNSFHIILNPVIVTTTTTTTTNRRVPRDSVFHSSLQQQQYQQQHYQQQQQQASSTSRFLCSSSPLYGSIRSYQQRSSSSSSTSSSTTTSCSKFQRLRPLSQQKQPPNNSLGILVWSYPPDGSDNNEPESDSNNNNKEEQQQDDDGTVGYDGLYEFLTRRTGDQAGESERQRKRDRIMEWMKSSKTSTSTNTKGNGGANLIQPIRLQDGQVDAELIASDRQQQQKQQEQQKTFQTKAKLDQLFAGMPTLDEILTKGSSTSNTAETETETGDSGIEMDENYSRRTRSSSSSSSNDDSWFDPERQSIEQEYEQIRDDMKEQIRQQRLQDPDGIPDNAEGIVEAIVQQEMERMVQAVKLTRAKERLQEYQLNQMADLNAKDFSGATDAVVEQILKQAAEDWQRRDKLQAQADEFYQYQTQQQQQQESGYNGNIPTPQDADDDSILDLDEWALERLEEMLEASQNRDDDNGSISDILEDNIEVLRQRIEKESKKGNIQPKTMKEWQMYRAIATRLAKSGGGGEKGDTIINEDDIDEALIAARLNSWREYIEKEDGIRRQSGLSTGPRLPFDSLGEKADRMPKQNNLTPAFEDEKKTRREIRREVNIQAIQAMEDLIRKSDSVRAEGLKKELAALKAELEPRDFNDTEEEIIEDVKTSMEPVDLSDVFRTSQDDSKKKGAVGGLSDDVYAGVNKILSNTGIEGLYGPSTTYQQETVPPTPPNTPFFSNAVDNNEERKIPPPPNTPFFQNDDDYDTDDETKMPPPPNTPFFSREGREGGRSGETLDIENKLGSVEEQKLQAMFRRAGARTKAEQDKIRQEWEAFQQFEKERRDLSGLSDDTVESTLLGNDANLKYDISDVMKGDGDFDADKILSTIGPRPTKRSKAPSNNIGSKDTQGLDASIDDDKLASDVSSADVADSLFRSVAAAGGGGRVADEERSQFDEYLAKQEELRQNLDRIDEDAAEVAKSMDVPVDDPKYAQDVLSSIGTRPVFKKRRKEVVDERMLSDMGGIRSRDDDFDDVPSSRDYSMSDDDDDVPSSSKDESAFDDIVPAWLKKEREAAAKSREESDVGMLGSSIDEMFDDDTYEKNLRQLHEYEQRRSGKKQMGIDISDIFGRRGSDDYVDYTYDTEYFRERQDGWGAASFQARKENLLQYVELDPAEVNSIMAQKESVYSTGVSQYLPRINKPFKDFGAIFRLEGVLVDMTGLQQKVWKRVSSEFSSEFGFKEPVAEDIQYAAVTRPEIAVREILFRVNDIVLERKVLDAYRRILREEFNAWATEEGIVVQERKKTSQEKTPEKGALTIGFDEPDPVPVVRPPQPIFEDEAERLKHLKDVWTKTAKQFGYPLPTNEQIAESAIIAPDIAVETVFRWSSDQIQIDQIVAAFSIMQAGNGYSFAKDRAFGGTVDMDVRDSQEEQNRPKSLSEGEVLEFQYHAWKKVANENLLEVPDPEEVLAAAVLNDPEAVISSGFGWTDDPQRISSLANQYRKCLSELLEGAGSVGLTIVEQPPPVPITNTGQNSKPIGPTDEEILTGQLEAWKATAVEFDFKVPSTDRIQMVMNASPRDAVAQLLLMDYDVDDDVLAEITEFYTEALGNALKKYFHQNNIISPNTTPMASSTVASHNKSKDVSSDEIYQAAFDAWTSIAWKNGYSMPDQEQVQFAMTVGPQQAILAGFRWTDSEEKAESLAKQYLDQIKTKRDDWVKRGYITTVAIETKTSLEVEEIPPVRVKPGVVDWIQSLRTVDMACGVVSFLEADQMTILLEYAGLSELFPEEVRVSHSNGYRTDSQQLLGAALRIERRPDHCVAFDTSPYGSVAAHDVEMRSVSLVGPYPRYELLSADTTSSSVDELTAMNIRRLFGERVYDQPELDMMSRQPENNRRVKTAYDWDDE